MFKINTPSPKAIKQGKARGILIFLIFFVCIFCALIPQKTQTNKEYNTDALTHNFSYLFPPETGFLGMQKDATIKPLWTEKEFTITKDNNTTSFYTAIFPTNLDDKTIKLESSNTDIAEISQDGIITAKQAGAVKIKATHIKSGNSCEANLVIKRGIDSIFMPTTTLVINKADSYRQLDLTIFPENATDKTIVWRSKNPLVATINQSGTLKPVGKGMTEIVAQTADGKHSAKCFVQVVDEVIKPQNIEIINKHAAYLDMGQSITMIATVAPYNSRDKSVSWTSSDTNIATVSQSGRVKAINEGKCRISAKTSNGKTDVVELTVNKSNYKNPFDANDRTTSANELPKDILGKTFVSNITTTANGLITYVSYQKTIDEAVDIQLSLSTPRTIWSGSSPANAQADDIYEYIDPQNYYHSSYKYQFMNLSRPNGITVAELNEYLKDKGILKGQGQAFIDAANEYNISEIYLVAHACLETGYGTSTLACGVNVNGTVVYNMFGIAAYDSDALSGGSQMAYKQGWTSPSAAIRGGARWISQNYINNEYGQNTLYDMLWNPANPGVHQYASDVSWAIKQTATIARFADRFPNAHLSYEIPVYQGETAISIY